MTGHVEDIVVRLRRRAQIRRGIPRPELDRISRDCEEAANEIEWLRLLVDQYQWANANVVHQVRSVSADTTLSMCDSCAEKVARGEVAVCGCTLFSPVVS